MKNLTMLASAFHHPNPNNKSSNDAYFVCPEKQTIGVADGAETQYAEEFMCNCSVALLGEYEGKVDPKRVLKIGYLNTRAKGSCTVCIASVKGNHLHYVNMGDSGLRLFRDKEVIHRSPVQRCEFDRSYELGRESYHPNFAHQKKILIQPGDVVVLGTDGLFDNIFDSEIAEILSGGEGKSAEDLARDIAELAHSHSMDDSYDSPFAKAAALAEKSHTGGRRDEITVVVGMIKSI